MHIGAKFARVYYILARVLYENYVCIYLCESYARTYTHT